MNSSSITPSIALELYPFCATKIGVPLVCLAVYSTVLTAMALSLATIVDSIIVGRLLESSSERIYCLVRRGKMTSAEKRLKTMLMYYFVSDYQKEFDSDGLCVIEADITDDNLTGKLKDFSFDIIVNCAAVVKHFAVGDTIEKVNVLGIKNLIEVTKAHNAKMIQISTVSVAAIESGMRAYNRCC